MGPWRTAVFTVVSHDGIQVMVTNEASMKLNVLHGSHRKNLFTGAVRPGNPKTVNWNLEARS